MSQAVAEPGQSQQLTRERKPSVSIEAFRQNGVTGKSAALLSKWAALALPRSKPLRPISLGVAGAFLSASRLLSGVYRNKLMELLDESDKRFSPLSDPFRLDLAKNRWFLSKHENAYSDWLAWIIEGLADPELVFSLFDIHVAPETVRGLTPRIQREFVVKGGHLGHTGRLDIFIEYEKRAVIVLELKVTSAENADTEKQQGYKESIERAYPKVAHYRLLVLQSQKNIYHDFSVITWTDICLRIRKLVSSRRVKNMMLGALMLCFAGAVEQSLLRLSIHESSQSIDSEIWSHIIS